MYPRIFTATALLAFSLLSVQTVHAAPLQRVPATTLTSVPLAPPTSNYTATNAFPNIVFTNPIGLYTPPGETNRLFVLEKRGRIVVITNLAVPTRSIFMSLTDRVTGSDTSVGGEEGLLGMAFHPGYATNGYFFVYYTGTDNTGVGGNTRHDILSRFSTSVANTNLGVASSEVKFLRQRDEASNHNAGELQFGADGYLYLSLGDEGNGDDSFGNSQRINLDFFSGIIRLDVDKRPGNLTPNTHPAVTTNYLVPADNPFVGATTFNGSAVNPAQVRTEFWAVGLRNPWRMAFDRQTGELYCADVGQGLLEEINLITKGRNYGWVYYEGSNRRTVPPGGFTHTPPILEYGRTNGYAVVGGQVYRGNNLSQLHGAYIYGDYGSGRIWALRQNGGVVTENRLIYTDNANNSGASGLSAFGVDPRNGDILYADEQNATDGSIKRIVPNSATGTPIPATLANVGAFSDLATLTPQPGIVPYDLNVPFWSDHAIKSRWFSVPNTNLTIGFARESNWSFPTGTVWVKHFELELTNGVPASRKRLETRLLVKNATGGYGVTYRWGDSLTNAALVPEGGLDETFVIYDGASPIRTQVWHYPSRVECLQCHTTSGGFALGFNTPQLNHAFNYDGTVTNQIVALSQAGYFSAAVSNVHTVPALVAATNELASLEVRARSYLAANCVQCHQPGGTSQALWDARYTTRTADAGLVNGALFNNGGNTNNRVLTPGSLNTSTLLARISTRGPGQMPPIGSTVVDTQAVTLISAWITNDLPAFRTFADWQLAWFGATNAPEAGAFADPDGDGAINQLEALTSTSPTNAAEIWNISLVLSNGQPHVQFPQLANRGFEVQTATSLFGSLWTPLDVPENAPFFSVSNRLGNVPDAAATGGARYYRVRVFEP